MEFSLIATFVVTRTLNFVSGILIDEKNFIVILYYIIYIIMSLKGKDDTIRRNNYFNEVSGGGAEYIMYFNCRYV